MAIPMLKIRRPLGRLIFNMGIATPGKTVFLIETAPWKFVKIMALVPGVYFLSMFPATVYGFVKNWFTPQVIVYMHRAATIMWFTHYWADPVIYAWNNEDFRQAIKAILQIRSRRIHNAEPGTA